MAVTNPLLKFTQPKPAVPATTWGGAVTGKMPTVMAAGPGLGGSPRESGATPMVATSTAMQKTNPAIFNAATAAAKAGQPTYAMPQGTQGQGTAAQTPGAPQSASPTFGAAVTQQPAPHPAAAAAPAANPWGAAGSPNWVTYQTGAPLYGQWFANGKDWGVQPRLNMAYAQLTGYTGGFGNAANNTWTAFYNALPDAMKAQVNALRASYPIQTMPAGPQQAPGAPGVTKEAGGTPQGPGGVNQTMPGYNTKPAATTPTPTATTPTPTAPTTTTTTGVPMGWEQTGAPPAGGAMPAGVSTVMPTFDQQSGQFQGYSPSSAQWGNTANMQTYYPGK
jgi:hypothetical protein